MDVVIAGGHGQIALRLIRLLTARGDQVRGLIRNPDHAGDLEELGATPVVCDMEAEDDLSSFVEGADAVVFAAGAGPGSGPERKKSVDLGAAVKLMEAGVGRYVMVSSIGADDPGAASGSFKPYIEAKAEADRRLAESGLIYTIVRPGPLTDEPGEGTVTAGPETDRAQISRDDVATTLMAVLDEPNTQGKTFNLVGGDTPIEEALRSL